MNLVITTVNSNNNKDNWNNNATKNDNNYNNNKFKFNHNDNWDNNDNNNNKSTFNSYENMDSNDNNKVNFNSNNNRGNNSNNNNYNPNSNDNRDNIKNKDNTTINNNNNNINRNDRNNPRTSKQRKRNIIWFNPTSSENVATKIGRYFFKLIDKYFPWDNIFHKMFNRNNIKVNYSCMPNIKLAIISHRRKILHPPVNN